MSTPRLALLNEVAAHDGTVRCAAVGPVSGQVLATGGDDCSLSVWRLGRPGALMTFREFRKPVTALAFAAAEGHLACGSESGGVRVFALGSQKVRAAFPGAHTAGVTALAWHPRGERYVASGGADCRVQLLDAGTGTVINTYSAEKAARTWVPSPGEVPAPPAVITALSFSPPGGWLAVGDASGRLTVWDLKEGKPLCVVEGAAAGGRGHRGAVTCLMWHPAELILSSGGLDRVVRFWGMGGPRRAASSYSGEVPPGTHPHGTLLAASPADTAPIKALCFLTPLPPQGGVSSTVDIETPTFPTRAIAAITDAHVRVWAVPGMHESALASGSTATLVVIDAPWPGVATAWHGSNARSSNEGGGAAKSTALQHLVVVSTQGPVMLAHALDASSLHKAIAVAAMSAVSGGTRGSGRQPGGGGSSAPAVAPVPTTAPTAISGGARIPVTAAAPRAPTLPTPCMSPAVDEGEEEEEEDGKMRHSSGRGGVVSARPVVRPPSRGSSPLLSDFSRGGFDDDGGYDDAPPSPPPEVHHEETQDAAFASPSPQQHAAASLRGDASGATSGEASILEDTMARKGDAAAGAGAVVASAPTALSSAMARIADVQAQLHALRGGNVANTAKAAATVTTATAASASPALAPIPLAVPSLILPSQPRPAAPAPVVATTAAAALPLFPPKTTSPRQVQAPMFLAPPLPVHHATTTTPRAPGDFVPATRTDPAGLSLEAFLPDNAAAGFGVSRVAPLAASGVFAWGLGVGRAPHEGRVFGSAARVGIEKSAHSDRSPPSSPMGAAAPRDQAQQQQAQLTQGHVLRALTGSRREAWVHAIRERREALASCAATWNGGFAGSSSGESVRRVFAEAVGRGLGVLGDILGTVSGVERVLTGGFGAEEGSIGAGGCEEPCLRINPCAVSGGGTGTLESLSLNLEGATGVLTASLAALASSSSSSSTSGRPSSDAHPALAPLSALVAVHTLTAVLRAFSPVLRNMLVTHAGASSGGRESPASALRGASGGSNSPVSLEPAVEDRLKRAAAALEALEMARVKVGSILSGGTLAWCGKGPGGGADTLSVSLANALMSASRGFVVLFDAWRSTL